MNDKRKARRKQTAEVFTPAWLVNDMLGKLCEYEDVFADPCKTFIDPACGNGNFLVEIVKLKAKNGHTNEEISSTVYGLDLMDDNVQEAHERIFTLLRANGVIDDQIIKNVLMRIKQANTLAFDFEDLDAWTLPDHITQDDIDAIRSNYEV